LREDLLPLLLLPAQLAQRFCAELGAAIIHPWCVGP
jgi:hypothetical protein